MEDVGAVLVDEHPGLILAVIGVPTHMGPALQHQHPLAAALGQLPGGHRAGTSCAHYQGVKGMCHENPAFSLIGAGRLTLPIPSKYNITFRE